MSSGLRLKDNFKRGGPGNQIPMAHHNLVAKLLNGARCVNGEVILTPDGIVINPYVLAAMGGSGGAMVGAWIAAKSPAADLDIQIQEGDIELGPDTVIAWADITNAPVADPVGSNPIITIPEGNDSWWIWVNVDIDAGTAELFSAATVTALTSEERFHMRQKRICWASISSDVITIVKPCQFGNIDIPRAAG